ncbi:MAG: sigma D regulator [Gammaproteobacteria bacterium]|nr:sigma D regulator [Gammaproteobacteria bacterium]
MHAQAVIERRVESHNKLNTLLSTRKETLLCLNQLASMRPFKADEDVQNLLQEFCESLVDYTASAHFQLYSFIESGSERRSSINDLAESVYPRIADSTQIILDFNEKYDCCDSCNNLKHLDSDLSKLGEILAERINYEDQIIELLIKGRD